MTKGPLPFFSIPYHFYFLSLSYVNKYLYRVLTSRFLARYVFSSELFSACSSTFTAIAVFVYQNDKFYRYGILEGVTQQLSLNGAGTAKPSRASGSISGFLWGLCSSIVCFLGIVDHCSSFFSFLCFN